MPGGGAVGAARRRTGLETQENLWFLISPEGVLDRERQHADVRGLRRERGGTGSDLDRIARIDESALRRDPQRRPRVGRESPAHVLAHRLQALGVVGLDAEDAELLEEAELHELAGVHRRQGLAPRAVVVVQCEADQRVPPRGVREQHDRRGVGLLQLRDGLAVIGHDPHGVEGLLEHPPHPAGEVLRERRRVRRGEKQGLAWIGRGGHRGIVGTLSDRSIGPAERADAPPDGGGNTGIATPLVPDATVPGRGRPGSRVSSMSDYASARLGRSLRMIIHTATVAMSSTTPSAIGARIARMLIAPASRFSSVA